MVTLATCVIDQRIIITTINTNAILAVSHAVIYNHIVIRLTEIDPSFTVQGFIVLYPIGFTISDLYPYHVIENNVLGDECIGHIIEPDSMIVRRDASEYCAIVDDKVNKSVRDINPMPR
jgi:hypothetical protein